MYQSNRRPHRLGGHTATTNGRIREFYRVGASKEDDAACPQAGLDAVKAMRN
jgi:hypothetical protein